MGKVSYSVRKKTATLTQKVNGKTKHRFPMPDTEHARLALQDLPKAHGLSPADKSKIKARAHRMLGGSSANAFKTAGTIWANRNK